MGARMGPPALAVAAARAATSPREPLPPGWAELCRQLANHHRREQRRRRYGPYDQERDGTV